MTPQPPQMPLYQNNPSVPPVGHICFTLAGESERQAAGAIWAPCIWTQWKAATMLFDGRCLACWSPAGQAVEQNMNLSQAGSDGRGGVLSLVGVCWYTGRGCSQGESRNRELGDIVQASLLKWRLSKNPNSENVWLVTQHRKYRFEPKTALDALKTPLWCVILIQIYLPMISNNQ